MDTKKRFLLIAVVFTGLLFASGILAALAIQQAEALNLKAITAGSVIKSVSNLSYLSNIYIIDLQPQVIGQWTVDYDSAYSDVSALQPYTSTEKPFATTLLESLQELKQNMSTVGAELAGSNNETMAVILWDRVNPQIENITESSLTLSAIVNNEENHTQQNSFIYLTIFATVLGALLIVIYTQIFGNTVKSIERLQRHEKALTRHSRELEKAVEERTMQLKESERLAGIGQTAGMVGHDIRNPLQAIISDVYLLKSDLTNFPMGELRDSMVESVESIERNVVYINKIVADLQDYARPLTPEYSEVVLSSVVQSVLETIIIPENIRLKVDVQDAEKLNTDQSFIRRALTNLINNAVQAMPDGGELAITGFEKDGVMHISVSDTGVGIPEDVKPKLFTPMVTTKSKGQGLGLAVVKRLVEALGGTISFESREGQGTEFLIELPSQGTTAK